MLNLRLIVGVYGVLGAFGAATSLALGQDPWRAKTPLLAGVLHDGAPPFALDAVSFALGLALAAGGVISARLFVARFAWARRLHAELSPVVRGNSDFDLVVIALASGIAEEILFRGLGTQLVGVVLSSIAFGALHQVRGPARFAWMGWATVMGIFLGGIFVVTGSLLGPIVAHVLTNAINLGFVRDHGAPPAPRPLGNMIRG